MLGATLADWQKKREEEARRIAELEARKAANVGRPNIKAIRQAQKDQDAAVRARWAAQAQAKQHVAAVESKLAREDAAEEARYVAAQKAKEQAAFDHRMSEHDGDQALVNAWKAQQEKQPAAAKVQAMPVKDDDPPKWWEKIANAAGQAWDATKTVVTSAFNMTKKVVTDFGDLVMETGRSLSNSFTKTVVPALHSATASVQNALTSVWDGTKKAVSDLAGNIKDLGNEIVTSFKEMPKQMVTVAYNSYVWADKKLDQIYDYQGPVNPPTGITGQLWSALPGVLPGNYILNNYQVSQFPPKWPSLNECVTAATIQDMNMMQDILASKFGIPSIPHSDLASFTTMFDSLGPRNWVARAPANIPVIGGMLLPQQAERVLNAHGDLLRENYGCGYSAQLTSGNTVDNLIANLQNGYPTSIHVAGPVSLFDPIGNHLALVGGYPHTVTLVGYDATTDTWKILDPMKNTTYTEWDTDQLMDNWGRQFLFYPPRFAMTTLIPDTTCTLPSSIPASATPSVVAPVTTPSPSQITQPPSTQTLTPPSP